MIAVPGSTTFSMARWVCADGSGIHCVAFRVSASSASIEMLMRAVFPGLSWEQSGEKMQFSLCLFIILQHKYRNKINEARDDVRGSLASGY